MIFYFITLTEPNLTDFTITTKTKNISDSLNVHLVFLVKYIKTSQIYFGFYGAF